ncbi:5177_t:CDS:1, partial [Scutellospora calospora]
TLINEIKFDPILNKDTASSVDIPIQFSFSNKEDESYSINILAYEGSNSNIEESITNSYKKPKKQKLERRGRSK